MLITADHGNAEMMIDPATGGPHTAHTTNPVPFIVISENAKQLTLKANGSLRDISPTILGHARSARAEGDDGTGFASDAEHEIVLSSPWEEDQSEGAVSGAPAFVRASFAARSPHFDAIQGVLGNRDTPQHRFAAS